MAKESSPLKHLHLFKVESQHEKDLDLHSAHQPDFVIVRESRAGTRDGNADSLCDIDPASDKTRPISADRYSTDVHF